MTTTSKNYGHKHFEKREDCEPDSDSYSPRRLARYGRTLVDLQNAMTEFERQAVVFEGQPASMDSAEYIRILDENREEPSCGSRRRLPVDKAATSFLYARWSYQDLPANVRNAFEAQDASLQSRAAKLEALFDERFGIDGI